MLLASLGCAERRLADDATWRAASPSRVDVFVEAVDPTDELLEVQLEDIALRDASGERVSLERRTARLSSDAAAHRTLLAGGGVPVGTYPVLLVTVASARLGRGESARELILRAPDDDQPAADGQGPVTYELPLGLTLATRDAASVFLRWDVRASLDGDGFRPVLRTELESPEVSLGRLWVADSATGTVLAFDRGSRRVTGSGKVGLGVRALAVAGDRRLLLAANEGEGTLSQFDLRSGLTVATIPLRSGSRPSDVVVVDSTGIAAVANAGLDTVSLVDVRTSERVADVRVGRRPVRLVAPPDGGRVFVVDSLSDQLSIVDVSSRGLAGTIRTDAEPTAVAVDRRGRELFVGHRTGGDLLVVDLSTYAVTERIPVGGDVTDVLADRRRDRVYVARSLPPELDVVDRRTLAVVRRIPLSAAVTALAQPLEGALVYGAAPSVGALLAIDVTVGREEAVLPCGDSPRDVITLE